MRISDPVPQGAVNIAKRLAKAARKLQEKLALDEAKVPRSRRTAPRNVVRRSDRDQFISTQRPKGYSRPIDVSALPPPGDGTAMMSFNLANGAADQYRTAANRESQAALIRRSGASVVGFQEVDAGADRTGNVHTALDLALRLEPSFAAFSSGRVPRVSMEAKAPRTAIRSGADGTTVHQTERGALVTSESFSGDDRRGGIAGDRGADATYGNALYVGAPNQLAAAYTVVLPHSHLTSTPPVASPRALAALASGKITAKERAALGATNEAVRDLSRTEPRTALVARVVGPDGRVKTVINVHTAAGRDNKALRDLQLKYLAQIVAAERAADPSREVVVMGDFNASVAEVGVALAPAGMRRVVGGRQASMANLDQIWVSAELEADTSAQVKTNGTSDHPHAAYTVIR